MVAHFIISLCFGILFYSVQLFGKPQPEQAEELTVQLLSTQTNITASSKSFVFLYLQNLTERPISNIKIKIYPTEDLDFLTITWPGNHSQKIKEASEYRILKLDPRSYKTVQITLEVDKSASFANFTAIFEISYTFQGASEIHRSALYRSLNLKAGPIEDIGILGVPISLAIYVIPGLLALIIFGSIIGSIPSSLPKVVEDNKLLVGFLISLSIIYLAEQISLVNYQSSISLYDLILLIGIGSGFGAVMGALVFYVKWRNLPPEIRFPPKDTDDLGHLLATYIRQKKTLESRPVRLEFKDEIYSGLQVKEKNGKDVILLPRQYKIAAPGTNENKLIRKLQNAYENKKVAKVSKLLERIKDNLEVVDGLKKIEEGIEKGFDGNTKPIKIKASKIKSREPENKRDQLLDFSP